MKTLIPFLVFCLIATCNAELRTWTAVNGKEVDAEFVSNEKGIVKLKLKSGKAFEVPANKLSKEDNEFISSLAKPEGVNVVELEFRQDIAGVTDLGVIAYLKGSDTPYAGKCHQLYENGQKMSEENWKDGKPNGAMVVWYENGQKKAEVNFKEGKANGLSVGWYENGQKMDEVNYRDGKEDGLGVGWHENGQKKFETTHKDGKKDGLETAWYENGQKQREENYKDGIMISEKWWNSKGEPVKRFRSQDLFSP